MKKLLSILSAVVLTSTASTSIIACRGAGGNETPSVIKVELNTKTLKANLVFTDAMTGQDAYNQLRTEIQKLSNGNYKDDKEIKNDNTLLISIWVSPTATLGDDTASNLNGRTEVDVKVEVTKDNKAFKMMGLTTLSGISVAKINLDMNELRNKLTFTKTMTGQDAYNQLRTEIQKLSSNIYRNTDEIKKDNTLLISIWVSSTATLGDDTASNLNGKTKVDVKVKVTKDNKAFNALDETLSGISVN